MGGRLNMVVFVGILVVVASLQLHTTKAQTTHTVGGSYGWGIPPQTNTTLYSIWASQQNFTVGDTLVFNFTATVHDVAEVRQEAVGSCNANNPISLSLTSPTSIVLNSTGGHYFICTIPGHCSLGQTLTINVSAASTPSPAPTPSSPTPTPSPVSPSPTPSPVSPTPSPPTPSPGSAPAPSPTATPPPGSAPAPSSTATPPPGSVPSPSSTTTPPPGSVTTPSPDTTTSPPPPPSPSSATSVAVTAVPLTLLAIALAFLN